MNRLISSRRWGLSIALLAIPVWAAAQPVGVTPQRPDNSAQPPRDRLPPTQHVGTAVLKGRIVDSASSAPVPRARVRLLGPAGSRPPVLTDAEGAFELSALSAGTCSLQVEKSTYLTGRSPGEYYVIAIDDIEGEDTQDPAVLERLTSSAIRLVLTDDAPIEVPLRRFNLADVVR